MDKEMEEEMKYNEILGRLKWWRLGSKDEEEHNFRMKQSNFSLILNNLKDMQLQSKELLKEHRQS